MIKPQYITGQWISVEDDLPELDVWVLVFCEATQDLNSIVLLDAICPVTKEWGGWQEHITHWMPLPPPPTED